jgi:cytochrome c peroxidase
MRVPWLVVCVVVAGCWQEQPLIDDTFTRDEWEFMQSFRLPAPRRCPTELTEVRCDAAARLGQQLFFERALSGPITISDPNALGPKDAAGLIACASCHDPGKFFIDARSQPNNVSLGTGYTKHNAMSVVNVAFKSVVAEANCASGDADPRVCSAVFSWTGAYPTPGGVLNLAGLGQAAMNSTKEQMVAVVRDNPSYLASYFNIFDGYPPACTATEAPCHSVEIVFHNLELVFEAYTLRLTSEAAPLDLYLAGSIGADDTTSNRAELGEQARRGLAVFIGKGMCVDCHRGPLLSDLRFHTTGVAQIGPHVVAADRGMGETLGLPQFDGTFLTPPLRHVSETAPYMHSGQHGSLSEVIEFYRRGGDPEGFVGTKDARMQPLEIDDREAQDLEVFLRTTLKGNDVDPALRAAP